MKTATVRGVLAGLAILCLPAAASAQAPRGAEAEVRAAIDRLFDAMRAGDSTAVRAAFHPDARLMSTALRDGQPQLREDAIDGFVRAVGTPHDEVWDERISDVEIEVDDPLASAWMEFRFYLGDRFSHCGVNAFQFVRTTDGWKVLQITDTRRASCD